MYVRVLVAAEMCNQVNGLHARTHKYVKMSKIIER